MPTLEDNKMKIKVLALVGVDARIPPSSYLFGINQYNDDPSGIIGDYQRFVGTVTGTNINAWYRAFLGDGSFLRMGLTLDIGGTRKVHDLAHNADFEFNHNRIELPFLLGLLERTKSGMVYAAIGIQYVSYSATLKVDTETPVVRSIAFEDDRGVPAGEYKYSLNEIGSYYFIFGLEGRFSRNYSGFIEIINSYANGIGEVDHSGSDKPRNVNLNPAYSRWNIGLRYDL